MNNCPPAVRDGLIKVLALHTWFRGSSIRDLKLTGMYESNRPCVGVCACFFVRCAHLRIYFPLAPHTHIHTHCHCPTDLYHFVFDKEDVHIQRDLDTLIFVSDWSKNNVVCTAPCTSFAARLPVLTPSSNHIGS
jgi:hypothetical protein